MSNAPSEENRPACGGESVGTKRARGGQRKSSMLTYHCFWRRKTMSPSGFWSGSIWDRSRQSQASAFVNEKLSEALLRCQKIFLSRSFEEFDVWSAVSGNSYIQSGPQDDPTYYSPRARAHVYVELTADENRNHSGSLPLK